MYSISLYSKQQQDFKISVCFYCITHMPSYSHESECIEKKGEESVCGNALFDILNAIIQTM